MEQINVKSLQTQTPKNANSLNNLWGAWQQLKDSEFSGFVGRSKVEKASINISGYSTSFEIKNIYSVQVHFIVDFNTPQKQDQMFEWVLKPGENHVFELDANGFKDYSILVTGFTINGTYYDTFDGKFQKTRNLILNSDNEKNNIKIRARAAVIGDRG